MNKHTLTGHHGTFFLKSLAFHLFGACTVMLMMTAQSHAVSLVYDGTISLESGNSCEAGATYRVGTQTTYEGKELDILIEVLETEKLKTSGCISFYGSDLSIVFASSSTASVFADLELSLVEKGTTTPVAVNSLTGIFKDIDRNLTSNIDYVYLDNPKSINISDDSNVTFDENLSFTSSAGNNYDTRLNGPDQKCAYMADPSSTPECVALATWGGHESHHSLNSIKLYLANDGEVSSTFFLSFNLDDAASIDLGDDFSDAPISFGEAYHTITPLLSLGYGGIADNETAAAYSDNADGDDIDAEKAADYDEEDGVLSFNQLADGYTDYDVSVVATNATDTDAKLIGWIDFNGNGFFESSEASIATVPVDSHAESFTLNWAINSSIPEGTIYSRFRISTDTALDASTATGYVSNGEVEDYNLTTMAAQPFACNSDSYVFTSDAADAPTFASVLDLANGSAYSANEGLAFYPTNINATGYNLKDGYIWGYDIGNNRVVRVGSDFKVETYTIPGLPNQNFHVGDVSPEGIFYMATMEYGGAEIHMVDANPLSASYKTYLGKIDLPTIDASKVDASLALEYPSFTEFGLIATEYVADFALHPFDKHLYFIGWQNKNTGVLYKTNVLTGEVTSIGNVGIPLTINANTTWFDNQGYMYFNHSADIYRIDLTDPDKPKPKAELFSTLTIPNYGDAARCSRAPITEHDYDFGDAPDTYGTDDIPANSSSGADSIGAKHIINPNIYLGSTAPDADSDGRPSADALGDDNAQTSDEDGISEFPELTIIDTSYTIPAADITVHNVTGNTAIIYAYIDFNRDGDFTDPGESTTATVNDGGTNPTGDLSWTNLSGLVEGETFIRLRISTDTTLTANGGANDGEVEDFTLSIGAAPVCEGYTGSTNQGISPVSQLVSGEKFFIASTAVSPVAGHLKAYSLTESGLPSELLWDAATTMNKTERMAALYSSTDSSSKVLFSQLDDLAFETNALPDVATIKNYTFEPSYDTGSPYLADRESGSYLGGISPNSKLALLGNEMDTLSYLNSATYRTFFSNTVSQRSDESSASIPKLVITSSDDGFIYAFKQSDGELLWGWMPRSLVKDLKNSSSFHLNHYMEGRIDVLDLENDSGFASYVIGSYKAGLGQFVLKLNDNGTLNDVIWDVDHQAANSVIDNSPNFGERAYFSDGDGKVYSAYVITNISGESTLHIQSLVDKSVHLQMMLNYKATSTPYVMTSSSSATAPAGKTIYLGAADGTVHAASLLTDAGALDSSANILSALNGTAVANLGVTADVTFIGGSVSSYDNSYYLRIQTHKRLAVFKYDAGRSSWSQIWNSYAGGAQKRSADGTAMVDDSEIDALPSDAIITDAAYIVSDSIVLPVATEPADDSNYCYGSAHYYFYKLNDGHFPSNTFFDTDGGSEVTAAMKIGYGNARRLHLANLPGADKMMGMGVSDQTLSNNVGINKSFSVNDPVTTGLRSWHELRD